jgi:3',5'-cyclic AMP phosphodiesterase CpdA
MRAVLAVVGLAHLLAGAAGCGPRSIPQRLQELPPDFKRVPYLQDVTPTEATVVWQTHSPEASLLRYWQGDSSKSVVTADTTVAIDHAITLKQLQPDTEYGYEVQTWEGRFTEAHTFRTAPPPGTRKAFKFLVFGDSGEGTPGQLQLADRMPGEKAALAIHVGDVAYDNGTEIDFDFRHFAVYKDLLGAVPFYPALGNHDIRTEMGQPYLDAFHLPDDNAERTERYYSFQYGNVFFVALDSNTGPSYVQRFGDLRDPGSAQVRWLEAELRRARSDPTVDWIVAYFHHPPFSSGGGIGGHGSDLLLRRSVQPLFDRYAVDLVFSGHDHDYERSFPIRCRDNQPASPACLVEVSDVKTAKQRDGTVYVVTGAGGGPFAWRSVGANWWTAFSRQIYEYVTVEVSDEGLHLKSLDVAGGVMDELRIARTLSPAGGAGAAAGAEAEPTPADSAGRKALLAPAAGEVPPDSAVADSIGPGAAPPAASGTAPPARPGAAPRAAPDASDAGTRPAPPGNPR